MRVSKRSMELLAALAVAAVTLGAHPLQAQSMRRLASARLRTGESRLAVNVEFAAGKFVLSADSTGGLYRSEMVYDERHYAPRNHYSPETGELTIGVTSRRHGGSSDDNGQHLDLALSPEVPTSLDLKFGAGDADVDLGGLSLTDAQLKMGASQTRVRFSAPNRVSCRQLTFQVGAVDFRADRLGNARCGRIELLGGAGDITVDFTGDWGKVAETVAEITVGVGGLTLRVPEGLGVAVEMTRFLSSFEQSGLQKRGDRYYSPNFDAATHRLRLDIKSAIGSVQLEWVPTSILSDAAAPGGRAAGQASRRTDGPAGKKIDKAAKAAKP